MMISGNSTRKIARWLGRTATMALRTGVSGGMYGIAATKDKTRNQANAIRLRDASSEQTDPIQRMQINPSRFSVGAE
jgi:transcription initiation factor TFIID subunit TAF12